MDLKELRKNIRNQLLKETQEIISEDNLMASLKDEQKKVLSTATGDQLINFKNKLKLITKPEQKAVFSARVADVSDIGGLFAAANIAIKV